jgi:hypothetical protein
MKISVAGIYERGIVDKERVHFRADTDLDLSFFVLLDTARKNSTQVYAGNRSAFWFAPQPIPKGQHVVVYTRAGTPNVEKRNDGSIYNFLFRGLTYPLYAQNEACVVLMEIQTWVSTFLQTTALPPPTPPAPTGLGILGALPTYSYGLPTPPTLADELGIAEPSYSQLLSEILKKKS